MREVEGKIKKLFVRRIGFHEDCFASYKQEGSVTHACRELYTTRILKELQEEVLECFDALKRPVRVF